MERSHKMNTARVIALKKFLVGIRAWSKFKKNMQKNIFFEELTQKKFMKQLETCNITLMTDYVNARWKAPDVYQCDSIVEHTIFWRDANRKFIQHLRIIENWSKHE